MKKLIFLLLLAILSASLHAQSIGQIHYGDQIFSTCLPPYDDNLLPEDQPLMSPERLQKALECVENTFGKVKEYHEYWGQCCGIHHLRVTLITDECVDFEDGCLTTMMITTPRFVVAKEYFRGGLCVGQKPGAPILDKVKVSPPGEERCVDFELLDKKATVTRGYQLDSDGKIVSIWLILDDI